MKEFIITKNDASLRLDKFITKNCPTLPTSLMFKYIRTKRIKVNGKRAEISTRLNVGDNVLKPEAESGGEKLDVSIDFATETVGISL